MTTFAAWLRATGHTHRGLTSRQLIRLWKEQRP